MYSARTASFLIAQLQNTHYAHDPQTGSWQEEEVLLSGQTQHKHERGERIKHAGLNSHAHTHTHQGYLFFLAITIRAL